MKDAATIKRENEEFAAKLNSGFKGKTMCLTVDEKGTKRTMVITGVKLKYKHSLIYEGTPFSVGFFQPIPAYFVIAKETEDGWKMGDIGLEVTVGGILIHEAIRFVTSS